MLDDAVIRALLAKCEKAQGDPNVDAEATLLRRAGAFHRQFRVPEGEAEWEERGVVVRGPSYRTVMGPAPDPALTYAELAFLLEHGPFGRKIVAAHPSTPRDVLDVLARDPDEEVRRTVAVHPQTSPSTLEYLAQDWPMASVVASNANTPVHVLHALMKRAWWRSLVDNPSSDATVLRYLSTKTDLPPDQTRELRYALARHPKTPDDVIAMLLDGAHANLKAEIAKRPARI